ncbi:MULTISPECIES: hypothetical protein [Bacillus cereus group]|uniref:hypothetical protein n=1 Tax=Bacillus cereus group TaxID=86661 RepID=UPI0003E1BD29|nr:MULTISPECIES: hypothetical protein [Bacillus cereus group]ETT85583.1 hypothetical protein C174_01834 [Bacillus mycoides FSL H7-687]MDI6535141.1 hypothetical protein [Bacillus mycoides]MED1512221.1 hypothetical protein [Bacillus proteolyticus]
MTAGWQFLGLLFCLGIFMVVLYIVVTVLQRLKEQSMYLQEIRDELKKQNGNTQDPLS